MPETYVKEEYKFAIAFNSARNPIKLLESFAETIGVKARLASRQQKKHSSAL